jgi:Xylose isomerase-like TIM barrel
MAIEILRSLWTNGFDLAGAIADCRGPDYDGVEGSIPAEPTAQREFIARLHADGDGLPFVHELATGGGYVPLERSPTAHLDDLRRGFERGAAARAVHHNVLFGCDAWRFGDRVAAFARALEVATEVGVTVSFETHRSRPTYSPWETTALLAELPEMRLTCDFSHWCCVTERLVLDDEPELLEVCAARCDHVHARVGHAQGPQVSDPGAPMYAAELATHERWWRALLAARADRGEPLTRLTCEFGPDGYQPVDPRSGHPVLTLDEVNRWMARRLRRRLAG